MTSELNPYADIQIDDTAQRLPLVLCLDTSSSMTGAPVAALNEALREWAGVLRSDISLNHSVELAVVTFGSRGVNVWRGPSRVAPESENPFVAALSFHPPELTASGVTPMVEALNVAMRIVERHKSQLRAEGLQYHRPQICLLTDGEPTDAEGHLTDAWEALVPVLEEQQRSRRFRMFAIGVGDMSPHGAAVLRRLAPKFHARLRGFPFREVLQMMSASVNAERRGAGDEVYEKLFADWNQRAAYEA